VVVGCGDQSIQRIRPRPSLLYSARRITHLSLYAFACWRNPPFEDPTCGKPMSGDPPSPLWDSPRDQRLQADVARNISHALRNAHPPRLAGTCNLSRCAESHGT
jgi:hypothetical protein